MSSHAGHRAGVPKLWRSLLVAALIPLTLVSLGAWLAGQYERVAADNASVNLSFRQQIAMQSLFSGMKDAETGQRGYIITGKQAFLEPFTASQRQVYRTLATLNALIVDQRGKPDPRTAQLHRLMDAKFAEMKNVRELRDSKGLQVAAGVIASGKGKQIMDSIRRVLGGMIQENEASLTRRLQSGKERVAFTRLSFWITLLNTSAIGFAVAVIIWTNRKARHVAGLQREEALARQKAIFESTSNPVILINPSGSIEVMNPAAEALFGFAATDLLRRDISLIVDLAPGDGPFLKRLGLTDGELAEPFRPHLLARRQNGDTVAVDVTLGPMPQGDGMHVVAVFRDISEREKIERMKDQFLSTISHELRTPLTSIVGSLGLLRGGAAAELPAAAQRLVVIAESNANRLIRIVNDLLDAEQLQSGQMTFDFKPFDLREAARNAVDGMRGLATTQSIALLIEEDGAPVMIRGDQDRLVQVIANLVSNAIKFSPKETRVTVSTKADFNGAHVRIVDQGPGIDPELRARLFTRFAQAARPMTSMPGTGLGLTISREIVHNHGGIIDFEDAPGGGSVFTFTLPAWNALTGQEDLNGAPRLLLYADAIDAMAITSGFAARSIRADAVGSAAAVLAAIEQRSYLAMILDFQFAEGEAIPLLHRIRAHPRGRDLPIIAIAAETPPVAPADMASLDIVDWITKPIATPRLDEAVGAAVQRASVDMPLVLHVDDDSDTLEITARALGGLARIAQATDVASARAFLAGNRPDIVIIDLALPDGSGLDILAEINLADTPATPVIIYSAQDGGAGYAREVEAVLTKSKRSLPNLVETVLSILERQKRESSHA